MKRAAGWLLTLAAAGGCVATDMDGMTRGNLGTSSGLSASMPRPPMLKGVVDARGAPVSAQPAVGPFAPGGAGMDGVGPEIMQAGMPGMGGPGNHLMGGPGMAGGVMPAGGMSQMPTPPIIPAGMPPMPPGMGGMPGMPGMGGMGGQQQQQQQMVRRTQVRFVGPAGAKIGWQVATGTVDATGRPVLMPAQLDLPGRFNFIPASIYRLKLSNIPGRPGLELYPTIEVVPANAKTDAFLAHNYVPVEFTDEDFDQVTAGNFITKVIYLPDPQFQMTNTGGAEELSSTRLDPGIDPVAEACKRGHLLMVVRLGGIDLEARNTPPLEGPAPCPPGGGQGGGMPMMPGMPGIAPPMPGGMPGMPPMSGPGGPTVRVPMAPNGPMIPGRPDMLPPMGGTAMQGGNKVQQAGYYTPDGKFVPCDPPVCQPPIFPQTALPPGEYPPGTPYGPGKEPVEKMSRRGIFATTPR
jgi:hypothetical protein